MIIQLCIVDLKDGYVKRSMASSYSVRLEFEGALYHIERQSERLNIFDDSYIQTRDCRNKK
ncbi:MAG: hypothetical protein HYV59_07520 [Planctomycetes bacterium]|nr:hypothetical protein [Planctomycetota bacterium]